MARAIPIAGYPSKTAAVSSLSAEGLNPEEIAERLGLHVVEVKVFLASARQRDSRMHSKKGKRWVVLEQSDLDRLEPYASRRGIPAVTLVRHLIKHSLKGGLIDAIMDDGT